MSQICIPASPKTIEWINAISEKTIIWVEIYNQQFQGGYFFKIVIDFQGVWS